jgi:hypothetical protein
MICLTELCQMIESAKDACRFRSIVEELVMHQGKRLLNGELPTLLSDGQDMDALALEARYVNFVQRIPRRIRQFAPLVQLALQRETKWFHLRLSYTRPIAV